MQSIYRDLCLFQHLAAECYNRQAEWVERELLQSSYKQWCWTSKSCRILGEAGAHVRNHPELPMLKCFTGRYRHQHATPEEPATFLHPCVLYLFLMVANGGSECRPGVNTHLQMTRVVVEGMQHSFKNLEGRTQCSREKDQK